MSTPDTNPTGKTVKLVPLAELTALARLVQAMRRAQAAYFRNRTDADLRAARDAERRCDAAASAALEREKQIIPGMEDGT